MFSHHLEVAGNDCGNAVKKVTVYKVLPSFSVYGVAHLRYARNHLKLSSNKHLEPK